MIEAIKKRRVNINIFVHVKNIFTYLKTNKQLRLLSLASVISFGIGDTQYQFQSAFYQMVWPVWAIGFAKAATNIAYFLSSQMSGRFIKKFSAIKFLLFQHIYTRIVSIIAYLFPTILSPIILVTPSFLWSAGEVARNSLLQKEFSDTQRATMASINSLLGSIFFAVFSLLIGFIADKTNPAKALLIGQICYVSAIWIYIKLFHHKDT